MTSSVNAWRRLRRVELRRWRSGQLTYHGRRMTVTSAWGVEGQPLPTTEAPDLQTTTTPPATPGTSGCKSCVRGVTE